MIWTVIVVAPAFFAAPAVLPAPLARPVNALLICEACREPTVHAFVRHQRVGEYGAYAQIFGCSCCKVERRYGLTL